MNVLIPTRDPARDGLVPWHDVPYTVRAANEGIPVAAIARIVNQPFADVYSTLKDEKSRGTIGDMPRSDWPPGVKISERVPIAAPTTDADMEFVCKKTFKLTALEAAFLVSLLKHRRVEKLSLHSIIEQRRASRASRPAGDTTDPKMVDVIICKMRAKMKLVDPSLKIETIWGDGYYIEATMKPKIIAVANGVPHEETATAPAGITNGNPTAAVH